MSAARRTAHASRTTAKGQRTREELVAAARRVFERQNGYFGARVADITAEAGVAHGSFYTYFASRQDVFVAVMQEVGEQFRVAVAVPPWVKPRAGVRAALDRANRRYLEAYRANSVIWALAEQVATMDEETTGSGCAAGSSTWSGRRTPSAAGRSAGSPTRTSTRARRPAMRAGARCCPTSRTGGWSADSDRSRERRGHAYTALWARAVGLRERPEARLVSRHLCRLRCGHAGAEEDVR